ncbi:MAG: hypothetical protein EA417_20505 [Gammaproteobacteria bacterium]|nr:MAG: hypothetical protein EA417_20505 [Gammaproteobacteria bacterium]
MMQGRALPLILLAVVIGLFVIVAVLPMLLSTGPGRGFVLGMVNDRVPGSVEMEKLSLSWFGHQRASGVRLRDPEGRDVVALESFDTELTLLRAIRGRLLLGETRLTGLRAELEVDADGRDNLSKALGLGQVDDEPPGRIVIPVTGHIILEDGYLSWTTPEFEPVVLDDLAAEVRLDPTSRDLDLKLNGRSLQGDMAGSLAVEGQIRRWLDDRGVLTPATMEPDLDMRLDNLPVRLLDGMAGLDGLLVAALGDNVAVQLDSAERRVDLRVDAPRLALDLGAELRDLSMVLTRAATLNWTLTPEFVARLAEGGDDPLRLHEAVDLRLALERLEAPLVGFDPARVAMRGRFDSSAPLRLAGGGLGALRLEGLGAEVISDVLSEAVTVTAGVDIHSEGRVGRFELDAALRELFDLDGRLQPDRLQVDATATLSDLPTPLLDRLAGGDGLLPAVLGPRINLAARASSTDGNRIDASLDVRSEHLQAENIRLRVADSIALIEPARMQYRLMPAVLVRLAPDATTRLRSPADLDLTVSEFHAPRPGPGEPALQPEASRLLARFATAAIELENTEGVRTRLGDVRMELSGDSLAAMALRGQAAVTQTAPGLLAALAASPLNVRLEADSGLAADGSLQQTDGRLELLGGAVDVRLPFRISAGMKTLTLTAPGRIHVPITPAFVAGFLTAEDGQDEIRMADMALLQIALDRLEVGLEEPALSTVRAEGKAELGRMRFLSGNRPLAAIEGLTAGLQLQGAEGRGRVNLDGRVTAEGSEPGIIKANVDLENLRPDGSGTMKLDLDLARLPAALLAAFADQPALPEVLGSALDVKLTSEVALGEVPRGSTSLRANARHLSADAELDLGDAIRLKQPAQLRLTLTPAAHAALQPPTESPDLGRLLVVADTVIDATVTRLSLPRGEAGSGRLPDLQARVNVAEARMQHSRTGERYLLQTLVANVGTEEAGQQLRAKVTGKVAEHDATPGDLDFELRVSNLFDADGAFSADRLSMDLNGRIQQLPVVVIDRFMGMDGLVVATLGRTLESRITGELRDGKGPITLEMRGENARADLAARLDDGVLTLRETLNAQVQPTEEFGRAVLARAHPLFETMRGGEEPIRFVMPAEGVVIPLRDYAIENVRIPEMQVILGKIELESGPMLQGLVTLGQRFGNLRPMGDTWTAEFTPAVMSVRDGKLAYTRRMDVLVGDQLHFASWGTMDLAAQRADLILGIMPLTLRSVFGIAASENDALRIAVTGGAGTASIDFSRIGSELGRLQAQRQLGASNPLFGALLGAAAGGSTPGLTGAPTPSISPLPWAERLAAQAEEAARRAREQQEQQQQQQQQQ